MPEHTDQPPRLRTDEPLLWLSGAGHETHGGSYYYFDARKRSDSPQVTIQLTLAGAGFHEDRRGHTVLPAGWAFLQAIPGPFEYGYHEACVRPYELVFVAIQGAVARRWYGRIVQRFGNVLNVGHVGPVAAIMLAIAHAHESNTLPDRYLTSSRLYQLIMLIFSELSARRVRTSPVAARALEIIDRRAAEREFNVIALAGELECSREYLSRVFRQSVGVSPSDFLVQHRVRRVAGELRSSRDKLDVIARRCGFSGANYLCRAFREQTGVTPARFRASPWMSV